MRQKVNKCCIDILKGQISRDIEILQNGYIIESNTLLHYDHSIFLEPKKNTNGRKIFKSLLD